MGSLSDKSAWQTEDTVVCGSRVMSREITGFSTGFSASFRVRRSEGCAAVAGWLNRAIGGTTPSHVLPSFSAIAKTGPTDVHIWTGSMVDTLSLSQSAPGSAVQVQVDAVSMWHGYAEGTGAFKGPGGMTANLTNRTVPTTGGAPETRASLRMDAETLLAKSWSLSISNTLQPVAGASDGLTLSAGGGAIPTGCDITLDMTLQSVADTMTEDLRMASLIPEDRPTIVLDLGAGTEALSITFEDCIIEAGGVDRTAEGPYDEVLHIRPGSIEVS
jgi:hypothetical protein